jgi:hypothetical protein
MSQLEEILKSQSANRIVFEAEFLGHTKMVMKAALDREIIKQEDQSSKNMCHYIPVIPGGPSPTIPTEKQIELTEYSDLPDIYVGFQYKEKLCPSFRKKFLMNDEFECLSYGAMNSDFKECGIEAGIDQAHIFACCPFIFVVDKKNLGGAPIPNSWQDLMKPEYKDKICINGTKYGPDLNVLLFYDRLFGHEGIAKLRDNTCATMHASRMNRYMGTSSNYGAGIYIMSWFFARAGRSKPSCKVIWPKEGAAFQPIFVMGKHGTFKKYRYIYDYLLGPECGQVLADNCFPALHPCVLNHLEGKRLNWFGWDYVTQDCTDESVAYVEDMFNDLQGSARKKECQ